MSGMGGRERNRVKCEAGEGGFQHRLKYWNLRYTHSPFGWSKFKPNALALKRIWDFYEVAVIREGLDSL